MNQITIGRIPKLDYADNEAMNTFSTNLSYCGADIRAVLVTSRYAGEGKSSIAMRLMLTLASLGKRVVLVDADLRRSTLTRRFELQSEVKGAPGLAQYLAGKNILKDVVYSTNVQNAYIVPSGREVLNSLQLLASPLYEHMMKALKANFDLVIIDTPPVGVIVDAVEIAKYCDGAVIVVAYNTGRKQDIADVADSISRTGCRVLGACLNGVKMDSFQNHKYYYRSGKYSYYYRGKYGDKYLKPDREQSDKK